MVKNEITELINEFKKNYDEINQSFPYHLNLIDELHANENAHSRILTKLLQYNENNQLPILQSLLTYIEDENNHFRFKHNNITPNSIINSESKRIDISIIDPGKKYGLIIENKIHGAGEQKRQIDNYIDKMIKNGIDKDNLYVIYLTSWGGGPSEYSFNMNKKEELNGRYAELSYCSDIIPWLENRVLPNICLKEKLLISGIEQYIDHLKGMFKLRKKDNEINECMFKFFQSNIGQINKIGGFASILDIVVSSQKSDDYRNFYYYLKQSKKIIFLQQSFDNIKSKYNQYSSHHQFFSNYPKIALVMSYDGSDFAVVLEFSNDNDLPYWGISTHFTDFERNKNKLITELIKSLKDYDIFKDITVSKHQKWYIKKKNDLYNDEEVYKEYEKGIQIIKKIIEGSK